MGPQPQHHLVSVDRLVSESRSTVMKNASIALLLLPLLAGQVALAQATPSQNAPAQDAPPVEDFKPASSNQAGKEYPQVNSERRARFRIVAPQAQSVRVSLFRGTPLTKGEDGAWIVTTRPWTRASITTPSTSTAPTFRTPAASSFTARAAGAAPSRSRPRMRTSMPSRTSRTASYARICTSPRAPTRRAAASSTRRRITTRTPMPAIRSCICSTARAKMRPGGGARGMRT